MSKGNRPTDYKTYEPVQLERALEAVSTGQMTQKQAARHFGVPQSTISRRMAKFR